MPRVLTRKSFAAPSLLHRLLAGAAGVAALLVSSAALAQSDLNPPLPNVLLLVDTSGSMEFKTNGDAPVCNPNQPLLQNDRSRWIDLVEVLTGKIDNYSCEAVSRSTSAFAAEYRFGALDPYDFLYSIPYHRPLSNGCGPGAGTHFTAAQNPFIYPATNPIGFHRFNWGTSCDNFSQIANDGILDSYKSLIRFGLMTFDSSVHAGTGHAAGPSTDFTSGRDGHWTYVVGAAADGMPYGCTGTPPDQEVGARNNAAPPWEGRLINFGHPDDGKRAYETKNTQIQQVLLATRPFGATPIAGMLRDAYDFLINDQTRDRDLLAGVDPASVEADFGPRRDPYLSCGRDRAVLLLTDGLPNMDLRPSCVAPGGNEELCPFQLPEKTAADLKQKDIPTYVVGFALDEATQDNTTKSCEDVNCDPVTSESAPALQACCTLRKIATAGGGTAAFATDKATLRAQIHKILSRRVNTTSRTQPAVGSSGTSGAGSVRFFSGFIPGLGGDETTAGRPWTGVLDRQRWTCKPDQSQGGILVPTPEPVEKSEGDMFVQNVADAGPDNRAIYTYIGGTGASANVFSRRTIRPLLKGADPNDGAGSYSGQVFGRLSQAFATALDAKALDIPAADCVVGSTTLDANTCRNHYMKWLLGYDNGTEYHRCPSAGECELVGDIFHSTPQIVGPPSALTRDESYARYSYEQADRPAVLYTSSNDGFLHAFRVDTEGGENNELWAFIPPATLPNLHTQYPHSHQFLLDGVPVVTDVVAADDPNEPLPLVFERSEAAAQGNSNTWRTVLVQSFGGEHSGYFALDVTEPVPNKSSLEDATKGGPRLLWQLTDGEDGVNLFGRGGATPAITTLFFDPEDGGTKPREIPVAVLPGGPGGSVVTGESPERTFNSGIESNYEPRKKVRKYDYPASELGARSLTIVRLDTGEIIRTFRQDDGEIANPNLKQRVIEVKELDSPVTGQPVAFPGLVGAVADRIFVGDNDGRLWKIDVSSRDPDEWTMKLFFDLYPAKLNGATSNLTAADGQPVMTVPVLSVDEDGNVTVNVATGDQDQLGSDADQRNFVWSLTDEVNPTDLTTKPVVNWYKELTGGDRAVGPLALFNGYLYFASFRPAVADQKACHSGRSSVWGMHYLERKTQNAPGDGGAPAADFPNQFIVQSEDAVVFGVSVVQQPSCYTVDDETAGDQFLGFGSQRRFTKVQPGQFQLVMHMGDTKQGTGNTNDTKSSVSTATIDLAQPNSASQVTGWASVLE